ncbi:hypothetical protein TNCV_4524421 [Trichonephila clavipes]|nr:hypothetical protein TNCV_4524421 [Trichonephila clavipes]
MSSSKSKLEQKAVNHHPIYSQKVVAKFNSFIRVLTYSVCHRVRMSALYKIRKSRNFFDEQRSKCYATEHLDTMTFAQLTHFRCETIDTAIKVKLMCVITSGSSSF